MYNVINAKQCTPFFFSSSTSYASTVVRANTLRRTTLQPQTNADTLLFVISLTLIIAPMLLRIHSASVTRSNTPILMLQSAPTFAHKLLDIRVTGLIPIPVIVSNCTAPPPETLQVGNLHRRPELEHRVGAFMQCESWRRGFGIAAARARRIEGGRVPGRARADGRPPTRKALRE